MQEQKRQEMTDSTIDALNKKLDRLIEAVSRLAPPPVPETDLGEADCFVWQADAGYEFMADELFRRLRANFYFLEFDSPRAGPLDALKLMPDGKWVVLGLVTTKSPELEQPEMLCQRVAEASAYVPMDRLCLSPQCGFSGNIGNTVMTADEQFAKLRLVADTARTLWGEP